MDKLSGGVARGLPAKGWPVPEVPAPLKKEPVARYKDALPGSML